MVPASHPCSYRLRQHLHRLPLSARCGGSFPLCQHQLSRSNSPRRQSRYNRPASRWDRQRIADDWNKAEPDHRLASLGAIQNTGQLENELRKIAAAEPKPIEDFKARYNQIADAAIKAYYDEKQKLLDQLGKEANATGFDLIPTAFWRWPVKGLPQGQGVASTWNGFLCHLCTFGPHLVGIALFAALLTLGAPYWYNLLKNLTSLRPALTQLLGKEDTAQTPPKK